MSSIDKSIQISKAHFNIVKMNMYDQLQQADKNGGRENNTTLLPTIRKLQSINIPTPTISIPKNSKRRSTHSKPK